MSLDVERFHGDFNGNLQSIANQEWNEVFDLATYVPSWIATLGAAMRNRVRHYIYISSVVAYRLPSAANEQSEPRVYTGGR